MRKRTNFEPLKKREGRRNSQIGLFGGIEGLEPSRFLKSTDFPLTINFIVAGIYIDM
jgi:hypothetical protein